MVDRRQGKLQYWAIWGWTPVIQSYPPVGHVLISPGTCARPARQRAYHDVGSVSVATLRETTWALRWRQRCITHRGSRVLEPNAIPIRNSVRTRRLDGGRLVVTGPDGRVVAQRLGPNRTRITAHMTHADDSSGSGLYYVHLRPGTCARVAAPEIPLTPTGLVVPTVVQIPFARLTRTPHVVEGHDSLSGATVATCIRLDGHPK